jgi:hypothetical protein
MFDAAVCLAGCEFNRDGPMGKQCPALQQRTLCADDCLGLPHNLLATLAGRDVS